MKKYLLLIENEDLWDKFKKIIVKDINTEIISLIENKIKKAKTSSKSSNFEEKGGKNDK